MTFNWCSAPYTGLYYWCSATKTMVFIISVMFPKQCHIASVCRLYKLCILFFINIILQLFSCKIILQISANLDWIILEDRLKFQTDCLHLKWLP